MRGLFVSSSREEDSTWLLRAHHHGSFGCDPVWSWEVQHVVSATDPCGAPPRTNQAVRFGVYFAAVDGEGVLMDLATDRYLALTGLGADIWRGFQDGASLERIAESIAERHALSSVQEGLAVVKDQLETWVLAGLLVTGPVASGESPRPRLPSKAARAGIYTPTTCSSASVPPVLRIGAASVCVRWLLLRRGLIGVLCWLQRFRGAQLIDLDERARAVIDVHARLRHHFGRRRADCLMRSLSLATALRWMGVDAEVCFGVRKFPFRAHVWVEVGGAAMNESRGALEPLEVIARF